MPVATGPISSLTTAFSGEALLAGRAMKHHSACPALFSNCKMVPPIRPDLTCCLRSQNTGKVKCSLPTPALTAAVTTPIKRFSHRKIRIPPFSQQHHNPITAKEVGLDPQRKGSRIRDPSSPLSCSNLWTFTPPFRVTSWETRNDGRPTPGKRRSHFLLQKATLTMLTLNSS